MLVDQFHRGEHHIGVGGLEPIVANDLSQEAIALLDVSDVVLAVRPAAAEFEVVLLCVGYQVVVHQLRAGVGMDLPGIVGPGT